jgi:iron-sulfur cluster assembly accessory protein
MVQIRHLVGVRNDPEGETIRLQARDREADAVDADGALVNDEVGEFPRQGNGEPVVLTDPLVSGHFGADVDMPLHEVAAETVADAEGTLEIDGIAGFQVPEIGEPQGFVEEVETHRAVLHFRDGETGPVVGDTFAEGEFSGEGGLHPEFRAGFDRLQRDDFAAGFHDACEHAGGYVATAGLDREKSRGRPGGFGLAPRRALPDFPGVTEVNYRVGNETLIKVLDGASTKLRSLLKKQGRLDHGALRVAVIGGGCSGLQYKMDLVDGPANRDILVESNEVRIVIDPKSALFVTGSVLDYSEDLQQGGFKVTNPNAVVTCSCGESFAA